MPQPMMPPPMMTTSWSAGPDSGSAMSRQV
jgi:hypothetical protein